MRSCCKPTPLQKFQHRYNLESQQLYNTRCSMEVFYGTQVQGLYTASKNLDDYGITNDCEKGGFRSRIPPCADACYDIKFVFEKGQECDLFLNEFNITDMYTRDFPFFMVSCELEECIIWTKYKPIDASVKWIYLKWEERSQLVRGNITTVNAYFVTVYNKGFFVTRNNANFKELYIVAKRIQKWWKHHWGILKTKRYIVKSRSLIRDELNYLPGGYLEGFVGGIVYQKAMEHFNSLK